MMSAAMLLASIQLAVPEGLRIGFGVRSAW